MMRAGLIALIAAATSGFAQPAQGGSGIRLSAGPVTQEELLSANQVLVRLRPPSRSRTAVRVRLVGKGGKRYGLGRTRVSSTTRIKVGFPLSRRARAIVGGCGRLRLVATAVVRHRGERTRHRVEKRVVRQPPHCGRFFGDQSIWNRRLPDDAPLDANSQAMVEAFRAEIVASYEQRKPPWINTDRFSTPVYTVPRDAKTVRVILDQPAHMQRELRAAFAKVPIPDGARQAKGTDANMVVWQPSRDRLWEFYRMYKDTNGHWHATYGGRLDDVSGGPGHFTGERRRWGATASSLPLAGGLMMIRELERGVINHALSMAIPNVRAGVYSLPAQRTDGRTQRETALPEGAHLRLNPNLDVESLNLPQPLLAIVRAAQRYGIYIRDGGSNVAIYGQDPTPFDEDPYPRIFGGYSPGELMRRFPWGQLQVLRMNLRRDPDGRPACGLLGCR